MKHELAVVSSKPATWSGPSFAQPGDTEPISRSFLARQQQEINTTQLRQKIYDVYPDTDTTGALVKCKSGQVFRFDIQNAMTAINNGGELIVPSIVQAVEENKKRRK